MRAERHAQWTPWRHAQCMSERDAQCQPERDAQCLSSRCAQAFFVRRARTGRLGALVGDMRASGFAAIAGPNARVLILGTLPGMASLAAGQYYAHPRNAFWGIMGALVGAAPTLPYADRVRRLVANRIALWDVCASAYRSGSLDAAIRSESVRPNDIARFLRHHRVRLICFNGTNAARMFRRLVAPSLGPSSRSVNLLTMPSTSPAYAGMPFTEKLGAWRGALAERGGETTGKR